MHIRRRPIRYQDRPGYPSAKPSQSREVIVIMVVGPPVARHSVGMRKQMPA